MDKKTTPSPQKKRQRRAPRKFTADYLHNATLYYLQRFASSAKNLERVLWRKARKSMKHHGEPSEETAKQMITDEVARCIRAGLINDTVYARAKVTSLRRRGASRRQITAKLREKGVASEEIDSALSHVDAENSDVKDAELTAAWRYAERRRLHTREPEKALAALARAGFGYDVAKRALTKPH